MMMMHMAKRRKVDVQQCCITSLSIDVVANELGEYLGLRDLVRFLGMTCMQLRAAYYKPHVVFTRRYPLFLPTNAAGTATRVHPCLAALLRRQTPQSPSTPTHLVLVHAPVRWSRTFVCAGRGSLLEHATPVEIPLSDMQVSVQELTVDYAMRESIETLFQTVPALKNLTTVHIDCVYPYWARGRKGARRPTIGAVVSPNIRTLRIRDLVKAPVYKTAIPEMLRAFPNAMLSIGTCQDIGLMNIVMRGNDADILHPEIIHRTRSIDYCALTSCSFEEHVQWLLRELPLSITQLHVWALPGHMPLARDLCLGPRNVQRLHVSLITDNSIDMIPHDIRPRVVRLDYRSETHSLHKLGTMDTFKSLQQVDLITPRIPIRVLFSGAPHLHFEWRAREERHEIIVRPVHAGAVLSPDEVKWVILVWTIASWIPEQRFPLQDVATIPLNTIQGFTAAPPNLKATLRVLTRASFPLIAPNVADALRTWGISLGTM